MSSTISSSTSALYIPPSPIEGQQVKDSGKDRDGDNDARKVGELEKPKATSGNVGTQINTTA